MKKRIFSLILMITMLMCSTALASSFPDVPDTHWALSYIEAIKSSNIIVGYEDGTFKPENKVKTGEFIKMASRIVWPNFEYTQPEAGEHWSMPYVNSIGHMVINPYMYDYERLERPITRAEAVEIVYFVYRFKNRGIEADMTEKYVKQYVDEAEITSEETRLFVNFCTQEGIITGFDDGTFGGEKTLTRAQAAKIMKIIELGD